MEFQKERGVFAREHTNGMYSTTVYYFSKVAIEFPLLIVMPLLEAAITFHGIEYREGAFNEILLVMVLTTQVGTSMGYFLSCVFSNMIVAAVLCVYFAIPSILFGGLPKNLGQVPSWISWFQYCSPSRYAYEAMLWAQWPNDEAGMQEYLTFDLGFWPCCLCLAIIALLFRTMTLIFFSALAKNAFQ